MKINRIVIAFFIISGISILIYLSVSNELFQSNLKEINKQSDINLDVKNAYNERGIYILNDEFYVAENEFIKIDTNKIHIEDGAIWRPKKNKPIFRISDINAPFQILKNMNNDTLNLIIGKDTVILLLKN